MLLYKNHRFCCAGVSFQIPDGYYLETNYEESPEDRDQDQQHGQPDLHERAGPAGSDH